MKLKELSSTLDIDKHIQYTFTYIYVHIALIKDCVHTKSERDGHVYLITG